MDTFVFTLYHASTFYQVDSIIHDAHIHSPNVRVWLESLLNGVKQKLVPIFQKDNNDRKAKKRAYLDVYNFP